MNNENVRKIFSLLRTQLQLKENEFLYLQRNDPDLLPPDGEQIQFIIDTIASLQLSTEDGLFICSSSNSFHHHPIPSTPLCSIDFNTIKNLPKDVWLSQSSSKTNPVNQQRLSLSVNSKTSRPQIPINNHLLFMPLTAFKPTSVDLTINSIDSLLESQSIYSKEFWLNKK
ncbi:unnamed protein product [Adineta ricciae]|uniref:Uncharacterized protein n=1 Tax=Adineta ricciae TaxID=249248 RepID=A0A814YZS7_ADIRI|nr:unnamed protein product [Adineta ricciae]CAF1283403.1 unnamed protein product [Adineta ricciae]